MTNKEIIEEFESWWASNFSGESEQLKMMMQAAYLAGTTMIALKMFIKDVESKYEQIEKEGLN